MRKVSTIVFETNDEAALIVVTFLNDWTAVVVNTFAITEPKIVAANSLSSETVEVDEVLGYSPYDDADGNTVKITFKWISVSEYSGSDNPIENGIYAIVEAE